MPCRLVRWANRAALLVTVAFIVAACETIPAPPLLSPLEVARFYGYTQFQANDRQYVVTYLGPRRMTSRITPEREADTLAARAFAVDFALWRSAQIAEQRGFSSFRVTQSRIDADIRTQESYDDRFIDLWPYRGAYWRRPLDPFPPSYYRSTTVTIQPRASLDITLQENAAPGDYRVTEVLRQVGQAYPGADGPAVVP